MPYCRPNFRDVQGVCVCEMQCCRLSMSCTLFNCQQYRIKSMNSWTFWFMRYYNVLVKLINYNGLTILAPLCSLRPGKQCQYNCFRDTRTCTCMCCTVLYMLACAWSELDQSVYWIDLSPIIRDISLGADVDGKQLSIINRLGVCNSNVMRNIRYRGDGRMIWILKWILKRSTP